MASAPSPALPPEIRVEQLSPGAVRYILPRRPLGKYRWLALGLVVFAAVALTFDIGWFAGIHGGFGKVEDIFAALFVAIGLVSMVPMVLAPLGLAAAIAWGHSEIEIDSGYLWLGEYIGLLRWRRRCRLLDVRRLVVQAVTLSSNEPRPKTASESKFGAICVELARGKPRWGALGYPREWLVPLAHELASHVHGAQSVASEPGAPEPPRIAIDDLVAVVETGLPVERFEQPAGSLVVMKEQPGSLTFEVPPAGIRRGTAGMFVFACIWLAFMAVFSSLAIGSLFAQGQQQPGQGQAPGFWGTLAIIAFIGLFWAVGIGLLLAALHMAKRRAAIAVAEGRCLVVQTGLFGEKKQVWEPGSLTAVQVGPSGMEVNDRPVLELQFIPRQGDKFGILSARDEAELEWLATRLTHALSLTPVRPGAAVVADVETRPDNCDAVFEDLDGAQTISVPPAGFRRGPLTYWIFALFWNGLNVAVGYAFVFFGPRQDFAEHLFPLAMFGLFAVAGLVLVGVAIHMTIRRAEFACAGGRLLVLQTGLWGKRRSEWSADQLAAIRAASSDTTMNNKRLMQLQIVPAEGKALNLLTGRDEQELAWIATLLRRALDVPAQTAAERPDSRPVASAPLQPRSGNGTQGRSAGPV